MLSRIFAPFWKPGMPVPFGYYRSFLHPDMIFRRRHDGAILGDISTRKMSQRSIEECVTSDPYAADGKKLTSEDAHRYGVALSTKKLREYFDWRSSVGLSWWEQIEAPANDNRPEKQKVAA